MTSKVPSPLYSDSAALLRRGWGKKNRGRELMAVLCASGGPRLEETGVPCAWPRTMGVVVPTHSHRRASKARAGGRASHRGPACSPCPDKEAFLGLLPLGGSSTCGRERRHRRGLRRPQEKRRGLALAASNVVISGWRARFRPLPANSHLYGKKEKNRQPGGLVLPRLG